MKLKKLHISNVASIQEAEIDFDAPPLSEERLFLITGDTGTGKSTIIDCLCLALYGTTPRMKAARRADYEVSREDQSAEESLYTNDPRQLLRRGCGSADVSLTFDDNEGTPYVATWHVHRARNQATGTLQPTIRTLSTEEGVIPPVFLRNKSEIDAFITRLIGLDVNQFFRTVVLAQGKFAEFLHADDNEKSLLLEKMMGIEIYSQVGKKIYEITSEKKRACDALSESLKDITLLTPDEIAAIEDERTQFKQEQATVRQQHDRAKAMKDWLDVKRQIEEELTTQSNQLTRLLQQIQEPAFDAKRQLLEQWDATTEARAELKRLQDARQHITALEAKRPAMEAEYGRLSIALDATYALLDEKNKRLENLHQEIARETPDSAMSIDQVNALKDTLNECKAAITAIKGQIETIGRQQDDIREMKDNLMEQQQLLASESATLELKKTIATRAHDELERHKNWNALLTQAHKSLHQGDQCPVCGHIIDTLLTPKSPSVLDELQTQYRQADQDWKQTQVRISASEKLISHLQGQIKKATDELEARRNALTEQRQATRQMLDKGGKSGVDFDTIEQTDALIADINSEVEKLNAILSEAQTLMTAIAQMKTSIPVMQEAKRNIGEGLTPHSSPQTPQSRLLAPDELVSLWNTLENKFLQWQTALSREQDTTREAQRKLNDFLTAMPSVTIEMLTGLCTHSSEEMAAIRAEQQQLTGKIQHLQGETAALQKRQTGHLARKPECDIENPEQLSAVIAQASGRDEQLNEEISTRTARLKADDDNRKIAGQKREQLAEAEALYSQWSRLNEMLGNADGAKFRKIALSYILDELLTIANQYLNRFNDRYELEAQPGALTILVRDLMQGDRTAATTLSGGESFMVSLALALALARMTGRVFTVDTIFIDEGFGTLSESYLSSVMETLNHLYDLGGRRVGIISHVEALKERIATQIHVERDPRNNTASHISITS